MVILVLDPAESTGYCLVQCIDNKASIYEYGFIDVEPNECAGKRCLNLMDKVKKIIQEHKVEQVGIEDYFFSGRFARGCNMNAAYRTALHILCASLDIPYTILNVSQWKKFIAGRSTPTKEQKKKWGKTPAKKLMIQEALWKKYGFRFPNHSISKKTNKPIKFRYDVVDAVALAVYFCQLYLNIMEVELSMPIVDDVEIKNKTYFNYEE